MAKFFDALTDGLTHFIEEQQLFFIATAPAEGRVNLSPKGIASMRISSPTELIWIDLGGSGNETAAHVRENGRLTLMFCSFGDKPLILRVYGRARTIQRRHPDWPTLHAHFAEFPAGRQIFVLDVDQVQTSCGFGVPVASELRDRTPPKAWSSEGSWDEQEKKLKSRGQDKSLDGLPTGLWSDS
jgi:hypothetical protein